MFGRTRLAIALGVTMACLLGLSADQVSAHSFYDPECCRGEDCSSIPAHWVKATPLGWRIDMLNVTVPYSQARRSADSAFHACLTPGGSLRHSGRQWCFYAPPMGF